MPEKIAVITGASSGFGLLTSLELARANFRVIATMRDLARRAPLDDAARAQGLAAQIDVRQLDVTEFDTLPGFIDKIVRDYGRIDVLINNAGFAVAGFAEDISLDELRLQLLDARLLLSSDISTQSRLLFARELLSRVRRIAPFLSYDQDPYLVVAGGGLKWIVDAYTTSDRYPYATPVSGLNYIRNSVKVVVDAYEGTVDFYLVDPSDPLAGSFAEIFPELFEGGPKPPAD